MEILSDWIVLWQVALGEIRFITYCTVHHRWKHRCNANCRDTIVISKCTDMSTLVKAIEEWQVR